MTASATQSAARAALSALIDYAGLFPPAALSPKEAMAQYLEARKGAHAWMLGRFIARSSHIDVLLPLIPAEEPPVAFSVIIEDVGDMAKLAALNKATLPARIEVLEAPLRSGDTAGALQKLAQHKQDDFPNAPLYVEAERPMIPALVAKRFRAKLRCGGVTADAFPGVEDVAAFIVDACAFRAAFKATAGLHHPLRGFNEGAQVTMHGFLNLLAATAIAANGGSRADVVDAVACEDASQFALDEASLRFRDRAFDAAAMQTVRDKAFVAYGSCSFEEPIDDLRAMGILK